MTQLSENIKSVWSNGG